MSPNKTLTYQRHYHGVWEAHGLSFSVPEGIRIPPSLRNIFKELKSDLGNHIVGIPRPLVKVDDLTLGEAYFWSKYYYTNKKNLNKYLSKTKVYYDQMISRFYLPYTDKSDCELIVEKLNYHLHIVSDFSII